MYSCIHFDSPEWCSKCQRNREACKNAPMKKNLWHISRYGEPVIGPKQASKGAVNCN